jgi:hypothetical protein
MKKLLFLSLLGLAFASVSCRTVAPLDPMTMQPSDRCLPGSAPAQVSYSGK